MSFADLPALHDDWTMCVHPQGWVYFYNHRYRVATDADIREEDVSRVIMDEYFDHDLQLDEGMEMHVMSPTIPADKLRQDVPRFNLMINHTRCVASYDLREVRTRNIALLSPADLNRRRRMYWNYLWNHPAHVATPERAIKDATDALTWFYTDNLISGPHSRVPFSKMECEELSRVLKDLTLPCNESSVSKTVFVSWLLREVCSFRDAEQYGLHTAKQAKVIREARKESRHTVRQPGPYMLPVLSIFINIFFFSIPWTYLVHVKRASEFRGRLTNVQRNWQDYINRLVREYTHFLLISTVLLSATVGFLALNDINQAARVGATTSAFASLGSIIVGVFSIWKHQINTATADSFTYTHNAQHRYFGYHGHAMLLSLPPVLLVWAIVTFTFAIVAYTLQGITDFDVYSPTSSWIIVCVFIIILVCVSLALHTLTIIWRFKRPPAWSLWRVRKRKADFAMHKSGSSV